jgi:hypothetical protein
VHTCILLLSSKLPEAMLLHGIDTQCFPAPESDYTPCTSAIYRVEQLLQYITTSLLRTHAYNLLQYHPFISSTPKTCLRTRCSRSFLFWHLIIVTNSIEERFASSALQTAPSRFYSELRLLPANFFQFFAFANPLPNPLSLESHTTQVPVQHGY